MDIIRDDNNSIDAQIDEAIGLVNANWWRARTNSIETEQREMGNVVDLDVVQENTQAQTQSMYAQTQSMYAQTQSMQAQAKPKNRVKFITKIKQMNKGTRRKAAAAIAATIVIATSIGLIKDEVKSFTYNSSTATAQVVKKETHYNTAVRDIDGNPVYYYDYADIAQGILSSDLDKDIDTRIYLAYSALKTYQKDENMDKVMKALQKIVTQDPLEYTEAEVRACNNSSFADYLAQLGMDKDDYIDFMKDVTKAYRDNDLMQVNQLLTQINGGGR